MKKNDNILIILSIKKVFVITFKSSGMDAMVTSGE